MKNASNYVNKLNALLKKLRNQYTPEAPPERAPVAHLVTAFLQYDATVEQADTACENIMGFVVDFNDLRVSFISEINEMIGPDYPRAEERIVRMLDALQEVYVREHDTAMLSLPSKGKKEVRNYLETLPGANLYVWAYVFLVGFGGHAMPVDDSIANRLKEEGVVDPDATIAEISAFLERQVKAADGLETYAVLQAWSDDSDKLAANRATRILIEEASDEPEEYDAAEEDKPTKKKTTKKKSTKKTTKKAAAPKKTTKKSTKKTTKKTTKKAVAPKKTTKKSTKKTTKKTTKKSSKKKATTKK